MTNIVSLDLEEAAYFRRTVLSVYQHDHVAKYSEGLCRCLAAANSNDPAVAVRYQDYELAHPEELKSAKRAVLLSIGYGYDPRTPDDVMVAIMAKVDEVRAA